MTEPWRIELFGGVRAVCGTTVIDRFRTEKTATLLAYLALHKGRPQPRGVLCDLLWAEADPERARQSLSTELWSLRRRFEDVARQAPLPLEASRTAVHLDACRVTTDVEEFEAAALIHDPTPVAVAGWRRAVAMYQEPLVAATAEDWVFCRQEALRQLLLETLLRLATHLGEAGDSSAALSYARRAVNVDPLSQTASLALVNLLAEDGDTAGAIREYQRLEQELRSALGAAPGEKVRERVLRLTGAGTLEGPGTDAAAPVPGATLAGAFRDPEAVGGAVPLHSPYYVARHCDRELAAAVERREMLVLLKGAGQMGKSSLLARGAEWARASGARLVLCDFQKLGQAQLSTPAALFGALGRWMAMQLQIEADDLPENIEMLGPSIGFEWFLRRTALAAGGRLVWAIDEADRLFQVPHGVELFRLIRSWFNERALDPSGPWTRLTVMLAYSTEAHLLIPDPNQSPFNVGCHIHLDDLTFAEVEQLNAAHGSPLRGRGELCRLIDLLGGHPYLIRASLACLAGRTGGIDWLEQQSRVEGGLFRAHLAHLRGEIRETAGAASALEAVARGAGVPDEEVFFRLRSAGLVVGSSARTARFRCRLYARHFGARSSG